MELAELCENGNVMGCNAEIMPKTSKSADGALSCLIAELDTMIELLNCDCMEYMATVPDKYFDLAIVVSRI